MQSFAFVTPIQLVNSEKLGDRDVCHATIQLNGEPIHAVLTEYAKDKSQFHKSGIVEGFFSQTSNPIVFRVSNFTPLEAEEIAF